MISLEQIKKRINESENPLIFFDDDPDGLCSYLLIKEYFKKGKGVIIKNSPFLDEGYLRKVEELKPDLILVLDKSMIHQEFADKANVPIIWIDHHQIQDVKGVHYFNGRNKNKWMARIQVDGKRLFLGYFKFPKEAAKTYDIAAKKYFGEFARLNFPN